MTRPTRGHAGPTPVRLRHAGAHALQFTASLSALAALNDTPDDGPMAMHSPVRGFRPSRAGRSVRANLPKPPAVTSSPRARASVMDPNTAPTAASAACFACPLRRGRARRYPASSFPRLPAFADRGERGSRSERQRSRTPPPIPNPIRLRRPGRSRRSRPCRRSASPPSPRPPRDPYPPRRLAGPPFVSYYAQQSRPRRGSGINKRQLAAQVAARTSLSKSDADAAMSAVFSAIAEW